MARKGKRSFGKTRGGLKIDTTRYDDRFLTPAQELRLQRMLTDPRDNPISLTQWTDPGLSELEDRREWHPDPGRGAITIGGRYASVTVHKRPVVARSQRFARWGFGPGLPTGLQVPVGVRFAHSFNVLTCIRRKVRRAVIFARRKAGRGVKKRLPRRTWRSAVWC